MEQAVEGPEEWWQKFAKEKREAREASEPLEEIGHQGRENRILEISGPDDDE